MPKLGEVETLSKETREAAIAREEKSGLFVVWSGIPYVRARGASLRTGVLSVVKEVRVPVPMAEVLRRAMGEPGEDGSSRGYEPKAARSAIYLHRASKPTVYFAIKAKGDGTYVFDTDYSRGDTKAALGDGISVKKGDPVPAALVGGTATVAALPAPKKPKREAREPAQLEAAGNKPKVALRKAGKRS